MTTGWSAYVPIHQSQTTIASPNASGVDFGVIIGVEATGSGNDATAVGYQASADSASTAIGENAQATNTGTTAVGTNAAALGASGTAIGNGAEAIAANSTAIGAGVKCQTSFLASAAGYDLGGDHLCTFNASSALVTLTSGTAFTVPADAHGIRSDADLYIPIILSPTSTGAASAALELTWPGGSSISVGSWSVPAGGPSIGIVAHVRVPYSCSSITVTLTNATFNGNATIIQ